MNFPIINSASDRMRSNISSLRDNIYSNLYFIIQNEDILNQNHVTVRSDTESPLKALFIDMI